MAGTISMAGLGSGMDVSGMIDALVSARGGQQRALKTRVSSTRGASTAISDIGSLLSKLKTAVDALADPTKAQGFAATSSGGGVEAATRCRSSDLQRPIEPIRPHIVRRATSSPCLAG